VNWESLPQQYREATGPIWQRYDLFEHTGLRARLGSAKDDISVLMTYVALDNYLKDHGKLCFVITQTLFKTVGGGEGFRRFRLGKTGQPVKALQVDDMVDLQPFEGATNRTAVFLCQKGEETEYPVEYHLWRKKEKGSIAIDLSWSEVQDRTIVRYWKAQSVDGSTQGPWICGKPKALRALRNVLGAAEYKAREGCSGGLNSVYLLKVVARENNKLRIQNFTDNAKKKVAHVEVLLEPDLVFPTLRGREVRRWQAIPEIAIVIPQNPDSPSNAMPLRTLQTKFPKTFNYLNGFYGDLTARTILKQYLQNQPFYAMYNTGPYTFAPYKVVWTRVGDDLRCAVVGGHKIGELSNEIVTPIETVVFVPFEDLDESHFFCALLNSSPSRFTVSSYSNKGTGSFGSPHILEHIAISKYQSENALHRELARLSKSCHQKTAADIDVRDLEEQIDELAAELWDLTKDELKEIKESLEEMQ
jgi:hypothetical protein